MEGDERAPEKHPEHPEHEGFVAEQRAHRLEKLKALRERGFELLSPTLRAVGALYATVEGFLRVPLLGRLLVPSVLSDARGE